MNYLLVIVERSSTFILFLGRSKSAVESKDSKVLQLISLPLICKFHYIMLFHVDTFKLDFSSIFCQRLFFFVLKVF